MRNKHIFKMKIRSRCPYKDCGKMSTRNVEIEYITNQRGDVIEQKVM